MIADMPKGKLCASSYHTDPFSVHKKLEFDDSLLNLSSWFSKQSSFKAGVSCEGALTPTETYLVPLV